MFIIDKISRLAGEIIVSLLVIYLLAQVVYGGSWM